ADQTLQSVDTPAEYRNRLQGRLRALNAAHDALFDTNWAPVRLDRLAKRVLAAFEPLEGDSERISIDVAPVMLPPWQLQSIALALHELGSNAVRHGALKYPDGTVELKIELLAHDNGGDDETLKLSWHERSASATWEKPARRGFGTVMLDNLLERQYDGATEMDWREDGFFFNAILPLRAVKEA
ncbi:MAG: hypothetical protein K8H87_08610, partial [Pseudorhodoplanes sp.]|nr:hypothetical protein [Pseudorhodoplanes sp.]